MIQLSHLSKGFGGQTLFDDLDWFIPGGERIGLVGPNGAGKTTLFRIIVGEESADDGRVIVHGDRRIGYLAQEIDVHTDNSVLEEVIEGRPRVLWLEQQMEALQKEMASAPDAATQTALSGRYAELEAEFTMLDGYTLRPQAERILSGMGFSQEAMHRRLDTFSGGWQMRTELSKLLLSAPDLLLMDEPTNHLDLPSIEWLESFLREYDGTIIIISHDRYFLNRMVTQIAELDRGRLTTYVGNWDDYQAQKEARRAQLDKAAGQQQKEIEKMEAFIERFRAKATKARQVQSRVKALEKIDRIETFDDGPREINFTFPQPPRSGKDVLQLCDLAKSYGDNVVYTGVEFKLDRGERVALVGPNGAGKTTLLRILAGELSFDEGERLVGHNVSVSYFAQHAVDLLDTSRTVLQEMESSASFEATPKVRSILGAFLFSGDAVNKKIAVLSGGEKNRLALAKMLLSPSNLLLMDEPTNHLDIQSCDVLEHALTHFQGTICFISHDRHFINALATRVVHVESGRLEEYPGDYEYYRFKRSEAAAAAANAAASEAGRGTSSRKELKRQRAELRQQKAAEMGDLKDRLASVEAAVARAEGEKERIEATLADPSIYGDGDKVRDLNVRNARLDDELAELYERWEEVGARVEAIERRFEALEADLE